MINTGEYSFEKYRKGIRIDYIEIVAKLWKRCPVLTSLDVKLSHSRF